MLGPAIMGETMVADAPLKEEDRVATVYVNHKVMRPYITVNNDYRVWWFARNGDDLCSASCGPMSFDEEGYGFYTGEDGVVYETYFIDCNETPGVLRRYHRTCWYSPWKELPKNQHGKGYDVATVRQVNHKMPYNEGNKKEPYNNCGITDVPPEWLVADLDGGHPWGLYLSSMLEFSRGQGLVVANSTCMDRVRMQNLQDYMRKPFYTDEGYSMENVTSCLERFLRVAWQNNNHRNKTESL